MASTIFYAWQANLPNATNRGLIQTALERAARSIRDDDSIAVEPVVDRDTSGAPGSPDIAATIFSKIELCHIFVADVSIIGTAPGVGPSVNQNVLYELGYAVRAHDWGRVIMVMNTAFGGPEQLPFDLQGRRVLTYEAKPEDLDRAISRKALEDRLRSACEAIFRATPPDARRSPPPTGADLAAGKLLEAELDTYAELWRMVVAVVDAAAALRPVADFTPPAGQTHEQRLAERASRLAQAHDEFLRYYGERALYYPPELAALFDALGRAVRMEVYESQETPRNAQYWRQARENLRVIEEAGAAALNAIRGRVETLRGVSSS